MNHTDAELLKQIADLDGVPQGGSVSLAKDHRSMPASGSSKIISGDFRARMVAISMRFTSPPDREASTSLSI